MFICCLFFSMETSLSLYNLPSAPFGLITYNITNSKGPDLWLTQKYCFVRFKYTSLDTNISIAQNDEKYNTKIDSLNQKDPNDLYVLFICLLLLEAEIMMIKFESFDRIVCVYEWRWFFLCFYCYIFLYILILTMDWSNIAYVFMHSLQKFEYTKAEQLLGWL